ncbi:MAG: hypothetical protein AMJ59_14515, partial [Gammaproteobacteria bacterium SG8_31]
ACGYACESCTREGQREGRCREDGIEARVWPVVLPRQHDPSQRIVKILRTDRTLPGRRLPGEKQVEMPAGAAG